MEIIIQATPEAATDVAASIIARLLREKPCVVHGHTTFNLDEYIGLPRAHPQTRRDNARFVSAIPASPPPDGGGS